MSTSLRPSIQELEISIGEMSTRYTDYIAQSTEALALLKTLEDNKDNIPRLTEMIKITELNISRNQKFLYVACQSATEVLQQCKKIASSFSEGCLQNFLDQDEVSQKCIQEIFDADPVYTKGQDMYNQILHSFLTHGIPTAI